MATHRLPVALGLPDSGVPIDTVANQITEATEPSIGTQRCFVIADGGADEGVRCKFTVPKNYVGTPKLIIRGILDGAPSAAQTLQFGFRKRAVDATPPGESADGTFDAEQTSDVKGRADDIIGSNGANYADEDEFELVIPLTAGDYAVDDSVYGYVYIDASGTDYAGNVLLCDEDSVFFEYADA